MATIGRAPRRLLKGEEVSVPYHRARGVRGPEILKSMRGGRLLRETVACHHDFPATLQGYLPQQIRLNRRRGSLDIPEHRQMGACLRAWTDWLGGAADVLASIAPADDQELRNGALLWSKRCQALSRRVAALAAAAPFTEAGEAPARLVLSALFRDDPAYRRFYRLWQDMNLGIAAIFGDFLTLPLARTFELYELWCFLRLVRAAAEAFGPEGLEVQDLFLSDARGGVTMAAGAVTVAGGQQLEALFPETVPRVLGREGRPGFLQSHNDARCGRGVRRAESARRLIVLDAKYRIDEGLNDALSSIHTYPRCVGPGIRGQGPSRVSSTLPIC